MLFNSIQFLIFFTVVTTLYFALPYRWRWLVLLASSCYFYMAFVPIYILILGFTIVVDYIAGIQIERSQGKRRRAFLIASIVANIGVLAFFKYYYFFASNIIGVASAFGWNNPLPALVVVLPIGLSFHTFQAVAYTVEVYRGNQKAERHFGIYALYVMYYPQLVAGPIERPQNLIHQLREPHDFKYERVRSGLQLMLWGFIKKIVIADRLAAMVDYVYDSPRQFRGLPLILATILFAFQIYCDFSGYSDIAIGAARVMGVRLMKNFNAPYFSTSVAEFWKRWHISLSTWFKDYVYIPLGGSRVVKWRWYYNILLTFVLSGFWHGAHWKFVIWGALNGVYLIVETWLLPVRERFFEKIKLHSRVRTVLSIAITFSLICFTWIFFRANSLSDAYYIITHLVSAGGSNVQEILSDADYRIKNLYLGADGFTLIFSFIAIGIMETIHTLQKKHGISAMLTRQPRFVRWSLYYVALMVIILFGVFTSGRQFIYFQF